MIRSEISRRDRSLLQASLSRWGARFAGIPIHEGTSSHRCLRRAIFESAQVRQRPRIARVAFVGPKIAAAPTPRGIDLRGLGGAGPRFPTAATSLRRATASAPRLAVRRTASVIPSGSAPAIASRSSAPALAKHRLTAACGPCLGKVSKPSTVAARPTAAGYTAAAFENGGCCNSPFHIETSP